MAHSSSNNKGVPSGFDIDDPNVILIRSTRQYNVQTGHWGAWARDSGPPLLTRRGGGGGGGEAADAGGQQQWLTYRFAQEGGEGEAAAGIVDDEIVDRGCLHVAPDLLDDHAALAEEILTRGAGMFRTYPIQGGREPRAHFLLHGAATHDKNNDDDDSGCDVDEQEVNDTTPQPGYSYGHGVRKLKARPLNDLPLVAELAATVEKLARVHFPSSGGNTAASASSAGTQQQEPYWNIGVNVVLYRDGRDHIGMHADNDQDENIIFSVIAAQPAQQQRSTGRRICRRRVVIQSNDETVRYELFLRAGDGYAMDGAMQRHYKHGVPAVPVPPVPLSFQTKDGSAPPPQQPQHRIAIVLRRGRPVCFTRDTGRRLTSLAPRGPPPPRLFGQVPGLDEGHVHTLHTITEKFRAHRNGQVGVSGNRTDGCDSILLVHRPPDLATATLPVQVDDSLASLEELRYTAILSKGGYRLDQSMALNRPIRVLRSSKSTAGSLFDAIRPTSRDGRSTRHSKCAPPVYRFDGLYFVDSVVHCDPHDDNNDQAKKSDQVYKTYRLVRAQHGMGPFDNRMAVPEFVQHCVDLGTMSNAALSVFTPVVTPAKKNPLPVQPRKSTSVAKKTKQSSKKRVFAAQSGKAKGDFGPEIVHRSDCQILYHYMAGRPRWMQAKILEHTIYRGKHCHHVQFHDDEGGRQWLYLDRKGTRFTAKGDFGPEIVHRSDCQIRYHYVAGRPRWVQAKILEHTIYRGKHCHCVQFYDEEGGRQWLYLDRKGTRFLLP